MRGHVTRRQIIRLLQLIEGSLDETASRRLRERIAKKPALARAHRRLLRARGVLQTLGEAEPPELPYRQIETQVRWRVAREEETTRSSEPPMRRAIGAFAPVLALVAAAAVGAVISLGAYHIASMIGDADTLVDRSRSARATVEGVALPRSDEIAALATLKAGDVSVALPGSDLVPLELNRPLSAGERVLTGPRGRVILQWGQDSGVALHGRSEMELRRLDKGGQIFALWRGRIGAQVKPNAKRRELSIIAGPIRAQVTGTHFSVALLDGVAEVEVYRGTVRVLDENGRSRIPAGGVLVPAGAQLRVEPEQKTAPAPTPRPDKAPSKIHLQPWPSLHRVLAGSGLLTVESDPPGAVLRLDEIEVGRTNLKLRGSAGRHKIELWRDGQLLRSEWAVIRPSGNDRLALDVPAPRPERAALPAQVYEAFRAREQEIRSCYERRLKRDPGLSGEIELRVRIGAGGEVELASLENDTLDDPAVGQCALAAVRGWRFPPGSPIEIVYPLAFHATR